MTYSNNMIRFFISLKNTHRVCLLLFGCLLSPCVFSAERFWDSISPGFLLGLNYGDAYIDHTDSNEYSNATGLTYSASGFAEKPLTDIFSLSAELHLTTVVQYGLGGSSSTGTLVSLGGVLGRTDKAGSPYASASIGYSYVDIGDSGEKQDPEEDNSCVIFCIKQHPFRYGGHAKGLGYRAAVGFIISNGIRLELAYMNLGGQANGLPEGSVGSIENMNVGARFQF